MAVEIICPRGEPMTVLLNAHVIKLPSSYTFTHGIVLLLSILAREASLCNATVSAGL